MQKIYQTIIHKNHGNCMQAALASLFELPLDLVPNFVEIKDWFKVFYAFISDNGYDYDGMLHNKYYTILCNPIGGCFDKWKFKKAITMHKNSLLEEKGIKGLFFASVLSPKHFGLQMPHTTHAVIIDRNYKIIFDPNPEYGLIKEYPLNQLLKFNGIINVYLINPKCKRLTV